MSTIKTTLALTGLRAGAGTQLTAAIEALVIAGWTGRDPEAVEAHIVELEALGIARPKSTPIFYRVAAALLTGAPVIEVPGQDSSGEVEPVLIGIGGKTWLGVGSDHTDRKLEAIGVTLSKQLCAKPLGQTLWLLDDVIGHWDRIVIRSHAIKNGQRRLYQEGPLSRMRSPDELLTRYLGTTILPAGMAMFCGTMAVHGQIEPAEAYDLEMEDPVLGRFLRHSYRVDFLPVEG